MRPYRLILPALCLLAAAAQPATPTWAEGLTEPGRAAPADSAAMRLSFAPVVKKAAPAVVNVYSARVVRQTIDPFGGIFGGMGIPQDRIAQSLGSGVIVRPDGVIVTNNHVVEGAQEIKVVLGDKREFPAKVLLADAHADVAVLKIDVGAEKLPVLALDDRDDSQIGDLVLAIGDPFGIGQTVTNGIVSALARSDVGISDDSYFIQTDAAINRGNSGGALVNMNGEMIGMNTAILSPSGGWSGVGFAIPAPLVKRVVETALAGGGVAQARPWLGIKTQEVTGEIARSLGLDRPEGVLITDVYPGGPGDRAGLKAGDLVLSVDGQPVGDEASLNYRIATRGPGDSVAIVVRGDKGQARTVTVRLAPPPGGAGQSETIAGRNPLSGATVASLTPAAAEQLGLDPFAARDGVVITKAGEGVAANFVQDGDIIRGLNGQAIHSVKELDAVLAAHTVGGWRLVILRGGQTITIQLGF